MAEYAQVPVHPSDHPDPFAPSQMAGTLDIAEAAQQLGISEAAVKVAIERGFLRGYFQESNGRWRVRLEYSGSAIDKAAPAEAGARRATGQTYRSPEPSPLPEPPRPAPQPAYRPPEPPGAPSAPLYAHASGMAYETVAQRRAEPPPAAAPPPPNRQEQRAEPYAARQEHPTEAPAPAAGVAGTVEAVLREQIAYLRDQLDRREAMLREKDAAVGELVQQLAKFAKRALPAQPEADNLRSEFDRYRAAQRDSLERHEQAIASISETLSLVRDHLVQLRPAGGKGAPPKI